MSCGSMDVISCGHKHRPTDVLLLAHGAGVLLFVQRFQIQDFHSMVLTVLGVTLQK